ncbi:hypothetical protein GCM10023318_50100 [Nocardia callitridis]|uniref:DUF5753 domain-containing protein n=1 Tax=Nocardia callitridis TaxID=648753 RepID=A0ABP9KRK8_9NOCA
MTIDNVARLIERGASTVQRLEKGEAQVVRMADIDALAKLYGVPEQVRRLKALAAEANASGEGWWHRYRDAVADDFGLYLSLESSATEIRIHQPYLFAGLMQTPSYVEALQVPLGGPLRH